jgi:hypothetical protein
VYLVYNAVAMSDNTTDTVTIALATFPSSQNNATMVVDGDLALGLPLFADGIFMRYDALPNGGFPGSGMGVVFSKDFLI